VKWIRDQWKGKLILKGIMNAGDGREGRRRPAPTRSWSSNHGGRQLDWRALLDRRAPRRIAGHRRPRGPKLLIDGGITSGQKPDARALALLREVRVSKHDLPLTCIANMSTRSFGTAARNYYRDNNEDAFLMHPGSD